MKKLLTFFTLAFALATPAAAQELNSLLWKVESPDKKVSYLFGTYHLIGSEYLKDHPKVAKAFEHSQTVVVETVLDSMAMLKAGMLTLMLDTGLSELLDSAEYSLLKSELEPLLGIDLAMFEHVKPIVLSTIYALALAREQSPEDFLSAGTPIDMHFAGEAEADGREVLSLETNEEQMEILFNSEPVEEQAATLMEMVKGEEDAGQLTDEIIASYQAENLDKMWALTQNLADVYGNMDALVDDRNKNWIPKLLPVLSKGEAFIAVGALHLPGENGLISLLKKEGFKLSAVR